VNLTTEVDPRPLPGAGRTLRVTTFFDDFYGYDFAGRSVRSPTAFSGYLNPRPRRRAHCPRPLLHSFRTNVSQNFRRIVAAVARE
jgi:hypothetical protein